MSTAAPIACSSCWGSGYAMSGRPCSCGSRPAPAVPVAPAYGIIDPDYARYYSIIRCTAWQYGYAIGMHGSFTRDLDLIMVPWNDEARGPAHVVNVIVSRTDLTIQHSSPSTKPHGRIVYTLNLPGFGDPRWIDLSIMPRVDVAAIQLAKQKQETP